MQTIVVELLGARLTLLSKNDSANSVMKISLIPILLTRMALLI